MSKNAESCRLFTIDSRSQKKSASLSQPATILSTRFPFPLVAPSTGGSRSVQRVHRCSAPCALVVLARRLFVTRTRSVSHALVSGTDGMMSSSSCRYCSADNKELLPTVSGLSTEVFCKRNPFFPPVPR